MIKQVLSKLKVGTSLSKTEREFVMKEFAKKGKPPTKHPKSLAGLIWEEVMQELVSAFDKFYQGYTVHFPMDNDKLQVVYVGKDDENHPTKFAYLIENGEFDWNIGNLSEIAHEVAKRNGDEDV